MGGDVSEELDEIIKEFITEAEEILENIDPLFVELEVRADDKELLNNIFRSMHTLKGAAGFLGFQQIVDVAHRAENIMKKIRDGEIKLSRLLIDIILKSVDILKEIINCIKENKTYDNDITLFLNEMDMAIKGAEEDNVTKQIDKDDLNEPKKEKEKEENIVSQKLQPIKQPLDATPKEKETMTNLRVEVSKIDKVMDLSGEIVLIRNRLMNLASKANKENMQEFFEQFSETTGFLDRVTSDLQLAVMKMRMQPIQKVFSKFPRMVRDLSHSLGKDIVLEIFGEDTEVDKSVIENIGDPLVHIIRNSIDHGIEYPEERIKKGKPSKGKITINAYQKGTQIVIDVIDDGKGIDIDALKNKAVSKGLISLEESQAMSNEEAVNLIFLPGLSTKDAASELSGRGVGMDVVRTNVSNLNGYVDVITSKDVGTTFRISLPLTIAIIQALMVKVGNEVYAIPQTMIEETLRINFSDLKNVTGQDVLNIRGKVLPVYHLHKVLNVPQEKDFKNQYLYVLVAALGDKKICITVDSLLGQEEIVIKTINGVDMEHCGVLGATITGDGRVVLIVDLALLMKTLNKK